MYGQLLAVALADGERDGQSEQDLLRELAHYRVRLMPRWGVGGGGPAVDAASSLAAQIDYDLTLLRLCQLRGIPCAPEGFGRPEPERHRLEKALSAAGVAVAETR